MLGEADLRAAVSQAHQMKGAAATVAAEQIRCLALKLETYAKTGTLNECRKLLEPLANAFECFKRSVEMEKWA